MSVYFDYETLNLKGPDGGPATPLSFAYGTAEGEQKEFLIHPKLYGLTDYEDNTIDGGWVKEYQGAYETHGINVKELDPVKYPGQQKAGRVLIQTEDELKQMYSEFLQQGEAIGFNNKNFDDKILAKDLARFGLGEVKTTDVREVAYSVLGRQGQDSSAWFHDTIKATNYRTTNEELGLLMGVDLSNVTLHDAADDIRVTEDLHKRLLKFGVLRDEILNAKNKQEWYRSYARAKKEFGAQVQALPVFDDFIAYGAELGINAEQIKNKVAVQRKKGFLKFGGVQPKLEKYYTPEEVQKIKDSIELAKNQNQSYNSSSKTATATNSVLQKAAKTTLTKLENFSEELTKKTGISQKWQSRAVKTTAVIAGLALAKSFFESRGESEEDKKLNELNQRVNGSNGEYIKY